ncbi:MAG TPA: tetratricopeptide repeat protein [Terriglobia bacterium]|nr:tetratricopeptide repeat protein [Terriglobia bacterium]
MNHDQICALCGQPIPPGQPDCPRCRRNLFLKPDTILSLTLAGLLVLFTITGFAVQAYKARYAALGRQWYQRGAKDLNAGHVDTAIVDFRTALIYARDDENCDLSLAQALSAAGRTEEAKAYLTGLWERDPGNAEVNLELGRLAARAGNTGDALRYYHGAMYDDWPGRDPAEARRQVRLELFQYLIQQGDQAQAEAELIAMAALLPPDPELYTRVGQLFMEVGDYQRASSEFEAALKLDRNAGEATLVGAGKAEFYLGNYEAARRHLERALRESPGAARRQQVEDMLEQATLVLSADPFASNLSLAERNRRVIQAFQEALQRLASCGVPASAPSGQSGTAPQPEAANNSLAALANQAGALQPQARPDSLLRNPDLATRIMSFVFDVEQASAAGCGAPQPLDRALMLLALRRGSSGQ